MNLLSISQICDQDFMVLFSKGKCLVLDEFGKKLISSVCTLDNCYGFVLDVDIVCNSIHLPNKDDTKGWDMLVTNIFQLYVSMNQSWGYRNLVE